MLPANKTNHQFAFVTLTPFQRDQVGNLLHFALNEIPLRIGQKQDAAASDLAYACHNLPNFHPPHFEWLYFRRWFTRFHELHGRFIYNYLAMLDAIEAGTAVSLETATLPLAEIIPVAHEFIQWSAPIEDNGQ